MIRRQRASSSSRYGKSRRYPLGIPIRKSEFLRRGSPKPHKSGAKATSGSDNDRSEVEKNSSVNVSSRNGVEGSKNSSRRNT